MLVLRTSDAYAISATGPLRAGTFGLWFTAAGSVTATTTSGNSIVIGGVVGSFFECPLASIQNLGTATVLGVLGR